ncbi:hypothetical protein J2Y69_000555 [Microbacterium resistens]|uniref:DUF3263 domain-containing protein n=1 Tax=Microbacterium resistens TaxID=156977 RepID=A0ABU1S8N1_9MICO|nr:hypothetical protein [Microbacterium resistens]MDR6865970.1 hypothetical protein [Microbacterium resistens]
MNTTLTASQTSKHAPPTTTGRDHLSIEFPREDELHRLSLADRVTLRLALRVLLRTQKAQDAARSQAHYDTIDRIRAEHELQRVRYAQPQRIL